MKHTKAPWKVTVTDGAKWPTKGDHVESYMIEPRPKSLPEMHWNADLIEAAPEMYAALKEAQLVLQEISDGCCLVSVNEAIKKAERGKS